MKIGFDIRRYGRVMESPSYQCCKLLKWIVLKIIHTDVIRKSRLIKWSKPYNVIFISTLKKTNINIDLVIIIEIDSQQWQFNPLNNQEIYRLIYMIINSAV